MCNESNASFTTIGEAKCSFSADRAAAAGELGLISRRKRISTSFADDGSEAGIIVTATYRVKIGIRFLTKNESYGRHRLYTKYIASIMLCLVFLVKQG